MTLPLLAYPGVLCSHCFAQLMLTRAKDNMCIAEHLPVPEFMLDMDTEIPFCPNNGKRWKVILPALASIELE